MLFNYRAHAGGDIGAIHELVSREATADGHIGRTVTHLADGREVDGLRGSVLELVIIAKHQGRCTGIERFAELETREGHDLVLAEGVRIVELATGGPVAAVGVLSGADAAGSRRQVRHVTGGIDDGISIIHCLGRMAFGIGEPVGGTMVGLIDER